MSTQRFSWGQVLSVLLGLALGAGLAGCGGSPFREVRVEGKITDAVTAKGVSGATVCARVGTGGRLLDEDCDVSREGGSYRIFLSWDETEHAFSLQELTVSRDGFQPYRATSDEMISYYPEHYVVRDVRLLPDGVPSWPPRFEYQCPVPGTPSRVAQGDWRGGVPVYALLDEHLIQAVSPGTQPCLGAIWAADTTVLDLVFGPEEIIYTIEVDLRVRRYDRQGNRLASWDVSSLVPDGFAGAGAFLAVDAGGAVALARKGTGTICRLTAGGEPAGCATVDDAAIQGMGLDADGALHIVSSAGGVYRLMRLDGEGGIESAWTVKRGAGVGEISELGGMAVSPAGEIFLSDAGSHRVLEFSPTGDFVTWWGLPGSGPGQFSNPGDLLVTGMNEGTVYVCDTGNRRLQRFNRVPGE